ncbi:MAG: DUF642 domain-containing protein [Bryobacteraceae bacterium]
MLGNRELCFSVFAAVIALSPMAAKADLITNGSFETGTFVNDGNATMTFNPGLTAMAGWTAVGREVSWITTPNPWGLSAQTGIFFLDLTAYNAGAPFGGVTQTVTTIVGEQYELAFYLGSYTQRWGGPPVSILASAASTSQTFTVSTASTASTWAPFSLVFTATSTNTAVSLTGAAGVAYIGLDNVSVNPVGATAVPEPGPIALVTAGLVLLALGFRKAQLPAR